MRRRDTGLSFSRRSLGGSGPLKPDEDRGSWLVFWSREKISRRGNVDRRDFFARRIRFAKRKPLRRAADNFSVAGGPLSMVWSPDAEARSRRVFGDTANRSARSTRTHQLSTVAIYQRSRSPPMREFSVQPRILKELASFGPRAFFSVIVLPEILKDRHRFRRQRRDIFRGGNFLIHDQSR